LLQHAQQLAVEGARDAAPKPATRRPRASHIGNQVQLRRLEAKTTPADLRVGLADHPLEHEADAIADRVMRMPEPGVVLARAPLQVSRKCADCEEEERRSTVPTATDSSTTVLRRRCAACEQETKVQRKAADPDAAPEAAPPIVNEALRSPGQPLDDATRAYFEPRFGYDLSGVRVHTGGVAEQSARDVNAHAYSVGQDIVFGANRYAPGTTGGQALIAHELTHVVQQGRPGPLSSRAAVRRQPILEKEDADCNIRNARAYIYFEIARRFYNPHDDNPAVVKRARCLKEAFKQLSPEHAVEFAQQIMQRKGIYESYETLASPTRLAIAEILVEILERKTTETYLARLLFAHAVTPYGDDKKIKKPAIVAIKKTDKDVLEITLDKDIVALAAADLLGTSECDKFTFGFTQFSTTGNFITDYYLPDLRKYFTIDQEHKLKPYLPCQDVLNKGDVWSYFKNLDCKSPNPVKSLDLTHPLIFSDAPNEAAPILSAKNTIFLTGLSWTNKFVTIFSVMLPNGVVHHISWFSWEIDYCETFPATPEGKSAIGAPPKDLSGRQFQITEIQEGAPPFAFADRVGKPADKPCNDLIRNLPIPPEDSFYHDSPLVKCR
jgi:hypothetical protein